MQMTRASRSKLLLLAGALVAMLVVGVGTGTSKTTAPKRGGDMVIMAGSNLPSWDPATAPNTIPGVQSDRFNALYGNLVWTDSKGQLQPGMAQSLTTKDFLTWTLKLRPGLKFTSGNAYNAAAVKANWDRIAAPGSGGVSQLFASQFQTKVEDATTLTCTLQRKDPSFALRIAELLAYIADPASLPAIGKPYTSPVGAGPFKFDSQVPGVSETVVRNPGYWEKNRPYLDKITWRFVSDPAQRVATVVSGDAQYMNGYTFQFQSSLNSQFSAFKVPAGGLRMYMFNVKKAPFKDVRARKAVVLATNAAELTQSLVQDPKATSWRSLFAKTSPFYDSKLLVPTQNDGQAQQLVNQITNNGANPLSFTIVIAAVPELQRAGQALQLQLNKINGIKADLKVVPLADWRNQTFTLHNYDLTFYPGVYDLNGADVQMTGLLGTAGAGNFTQFDSRKMNQLLANARAALDTKRKVARYDEVQQLYLQSLPVYMFGIDYRAFFHTNKIGGFTPTGSGALLMKELYYNS